ncbi:hypothetical protein FRC02_002052 [Tulasnella sp. 418]|nr:hypothetical protein FRC02_002052 [Tulasnella sp. 418]
MGNTKDFTILAPEASIEIEHDLAGVYNFTTEGKYDFQVANFFFMSTPHCHSILDRPCHWRS